ncbi:MULTISPECIES: hypothetical protein [Cyclobacterium]|uniref:Uncharacterized protein n=2 Tax=Cyclobacterium TaxID=68288 RepID=A0A1M7K7S6_9BACT|nr:MULTISPECIES: hypothetical protein [Cyclobacterium]MBD3629166.1 hypothetical protein [Cyclobacterium sp.]NHE55245.1 hypothetical protein [Cyclobacterium plantarum]SHM61245.1 hypothetical protein SAMN04488057_102331 [Cyclobacterium lianum]
MLKYTFETNTHELKTWVDPNNGNLNIQIGDETVNIPHETGMELIAVIRQKQVMYREVDRKRLSSWSKFMEMISGDDKNNIWSSSVSEN